MTTIASIHIPVTLDYSGFRRGLGDMESMADRTGAEVGRNIASGLSSQRSHISSVATGIFQGIGQNIAMTLTNAITGAMQSALSAGMGAITSSLKTSSDFSNLASTMNHVAGSAAESTKQLAFARAEAERFSLSIENTSGAYVKLAAAGKGAGLAISDIQQMYTSTLQAARVFNLSVEDTEALFLAQSQSISKGTLSLEELSGQFGERYPGALDTAARAMRMTTAQFVDLVSQGKIASKDFWPRMSEQIGSQTQGGVAGALKTATAAGMRLENQLTLLRQSFGDAITPVFTAALEFITNTLKGINIDFSTLGAKAQEFADKLSRNKELTEVLSKALSSLANDSMAFVIKQAEAITKHLEKNPDAIKDAIKDTAEWARELKPILDTTAQIMKNFGQILSLVGSVGRGLSEWTEWASKTAVIPGQQSRLGGQKQGGSMTEQDAMYQAFVGQESGGNPNAVSSAGALGLAQVMPENIAKWGKRYLNEDITIQQYRNSPQLQERLAKAAMWDMYQKHLKTTGNDAGLARRMTYAEWYSGKPYRHNDPTPERSGPSVKTYSDQVEARYQKLGRTDPAIIRFDKNKPDFTLRSPIDKPIATNQAIQKIGAPRRHRNGTHEGTDVGMPYGSNVYAPFSGKIASVWQDSAKEYFTTVETITADGKKVAVKLGHLSKNLFKVGQQVEAGQVIGKTGGKGSGSTFDHLHVEARINNVLQDPEKFFKGSSLYSSVDMTTASGITKQQMEQNRIRERAVEEARAARKQEDASKEARLQQERRDRDAKFDLETQRQALNLTGDALKLHEMERENAKKIIQLEDDRNDLITARSIKIREGEKGGADYTAAIKNIDGIIAGTKDLNKAEQDRLKTANELAAVQQKDQDAINALGKQNQMTQKIWDARQANEEYIARNQQAGFEKWWNGLVEKERTDKLFADALDSAYADDPGRFSSYASGIQLTASAFTGLNDTVARFSEFSFAPMTSEAEELAAALTNTVGGAFKGLIKDLITGSKSFGEVVIGVLGNLASSLADLALNNIFGQAGGGGGGLLGGLFSNLFGGGGRGGSLGGGFGLSFANLGGITPFAEGGVITKPTVGLLGEAGEPEVAAPLSKWDDLVGETQGNKGGDIVNNITITNNAPYSPEDTRKQADMIQNAILSTLVQQKRPGGLLS